MKRLAILCLLCISLFASLFTHAQILAVVGSKPAGGTVASGSVTQANFRLSSANGVALVDFNAAGTLCPYVGYKLTINDHSAHPLVGWIKSCGAGETYGSELLSNTAFTTTTGVTAGVSTLTSVACTSVSTKCLQVTATANFGYGCETFSSAAGQLLKSIVSAVKGTETSLAYHRMSSATCQGTSIGNPLNISPTSTYTQYTIYGSALAGTTAQVWTTFTNTKTYLFGDPSVKQVLTPSATGVVIVSAQDGSTQNWTSINGSFIYNDTSGYTYTISYN